jgi:hypothetical protein
VVRIAEVEDVAAELRDIRTAVDTIDENRDLLDEFLLMSIDAAYRNLTECELTIKRWLEEEERRARVAEALKAAQKPSPKKKKKKPWWQLW